MSTPAQIDNERNLHRGGLPECKPLLDAATKDIFLKNAFRITGLSVDASVREVSKHADKIKMFLELGQDTHTHGSAFPIKPSPSLDDIREAIKKLKDPEKRLIDEFFWFWPEEFGNSQADPAMKAISVGDFETAQEFWRAKEDQPIAGLVAKHNLALMFHISALDWEHYSLKNEIDNEQRQKITDYWKSAYDHWEHLATDETFWELVASRIRQMNEPNLPTGFARRMRATLPEALGKINAELAVAFAESGKTEFARLHIHFMRETHRGLDNGEKTAELVLTPAKNRIRTQMVLAKERSSKNPRDGANAARDLLNLARPDLNLFDLFFDKSSQSRSDAFDEVAELCNQLPIAYQKATGDDKTCLEVLYAALTFAVSQNLRSKIQEGIEVLNSNISQKAQEPIYALLKQIQNSPEHPKAKLAKMTSQVLPLVRAYVARQPAATMFGLEPNRREK